MSDVHYIGVDFDPDPVSARRNRDYLVSDTGFNSIDWDAYDEAIGNERDPSEFLAPEWHDYDFEDLAEREMAGQYD